MCQENDVNVGVLNGANCSKAIESVLKIVTPNQKEGSYAFSVGWAGTISDKVRRFKSSLQQNNRKGGKN